MNNSYTSYSFHESALEIAPELRGASAKYREVARAVFDAWTKTPPAPNSVPTGGKLTRCDEGKGGVVVGRLDFFTKAEPSTKLVSFILRFYSGPEAVKTLEEERSHIDKLKTFINDCLAVETLDISLKEPPVLVLSSAENRHSQLQHLHDVVRHTLDLADEAIDALSQSLKHFMSRVTNAYAKLSHVTQMAMTSYFDSEVVKVLPPEILVEARWGLEILGEDTIVINLEHSTPKIDRAIEVDEETLYDMADAASPARTLIKTTVFLDEVEGTVLQFRTAHRRIWIRLKEAAPLPERRAGWSLVLRLGDPDIEVLTGFRALQALDYREEETISVREFRELCNLALKHVRMRANHNDMHCKNVLASRDRQVLVDFGVYLQSPIVIDQARLEIDLWKRTDSLDLETGAILRALEERRPSGLNPRSRAFYKILTAIRDGALVQEDELVEPEQEALVYALQVLAYQRYDLREDKTASNAFRTVSEYWLGRFRKLARERTEHRTRAPTSRVSGAQSGVVPVAVSRPDSGGDTLLSLWRQSLVQSHTAGLTPGAQKFLDELVRCDGARLSRPLTPFQQEILDKCRQAELDMKAEAAVNPKASVDTVRASSFHPFWSTRHVVMAAPTSTGKTTVADMFLVRAALTSKSFCTIYVAPTRALAQAKHRELLTMLGDHPLADHTYLSTGEDNQNDWEIAHGYFAIACLVYEKANILLSRHPKLNRSVQCIVVDEMHMLCDIDRGPVLELLLTKLIEQRRIAERSRRDVEPNPLRIVAISTEDCDDQGIFEFLTAHSHISNDWDLAPLLLGHRRRENVYQHSLVLRGDGAQPYRLFPFARFTGDETRILSEERLCEIEEELLQVHVPWSESADSRERDRRLMQLLGAERQKKGPLEEEPDGGGLLKQRGRRILVFVPGRARVEDLAQRLAEDPIMQSPGRKSAAGSSEGVRKLLDDVKQAEDRDMATILAKCLPAGVFVHHADIPQRVRSHIEALCAEPIGAEAPSQVIFATETLAYGINLAVHDVILLDVQFPSSTRMRKFEELPLSLSGFHNMIGRCGRLGKVEQGYVSWVYIIVAARRDPMYEILRHYYTRVDPVRSQVFLADDREAIRKKDLNPLTEPAPTLESFSYPFVRSVLDCLRHKTVERGGDGPSTSRVRKKEKVENLISFYGSTLYGRQNINASGLTNKQASNTKKLLDQALLHVLTGCAGSEYGLVLSDVSSSTEAFYSITPRGEAVIDTGTEVLSIKPLMQMVRDVQQIWTECKVGRAFPTDLYLLCLVSIEECYRQHVRALPESPSEAGQWSTQKIQDNQKDVKHDFVRAIATIVGESSDVLAERLLGAIKQWETARSIDSGYADGGADMLLRLFNAIVAWVNGREFEERKRLLEARVSPQHKTKMSWRQFTEQQLTWKASFLARMLATGRKGVDLKLDPTPEEQRNLHRLAWRLRYGCKADAIPIFLCWKRDSGRSARAFVQILEQHRFTPSRLLTVPDLKRPPAVRDVPWLQDNLRRYVTNQFRELREELTSNDADTAPRQLVNQFWAEMLQDRSMMLLESIRAFRELTDKTMNFDRLIRDNLHFPNLGGLDGIVTDNPDPVGVRWLLWKSGENEQQAEKEGPPKKEWQVELRIAGVQARSDGMVALGDAGWMTLADVLAKFWKYQHLVLVVSPWLPETLPEAASLALQQRSAQGFTTTWISPAAMGVAASAIVRKLSNTAIEDFLRLWRPLTNDDPRPLSVKGIPIRFIGVQELDPLLRPVMTVIREYVNQHFEVRPEAADG